MEAILYAEIYLISILITGVLLTWFLTTGGSATPERWIKYLLIAFLLCFSSNLLFTLFNRIFIIDGLSFLLSYFFKTMYFVCLCIGVFTWCGYTNTESGNRTYAKRKKRNVYYIPFLIPIAFCIINLKTHWIFAITANGEYIRCWMYYILLSYLIVVSMSHSIILLIANRNVQDPRRASHTLVTASFPFCLLIALSLAFVGEKVPVVVIVMTVEILCIALGNSNMRISVDKLTMVNNRNNLMGFINYKIKNHDGNLYLFMIDIDRFKSINDNYGHLIGDEALVLVSKVLKSACVPFKKRPYIARFGGDEFIIVMEAEPFEVQSLYERINELIEVENKNTE